MGDEFTIEDALIILKRRILFFIVPAVASLALLAVVIMLLPAMYAAQGTMMVESAQIPTDLVRSTVNAYAQERIQTIRQRVTTRERLLAISDKFDLFPSEQGYTDSRRVVLMRERLGVWPITAKSTRASAAGDGTIAFTISYTDPSADKAYLVANEFMAMFQAEDLLSRKSGAENTTEFFKAEAGKVGQQVSELEARIAAFKAENANSLPEHLGMHLDLLERAQRELSTTDQQIAALEEELRFLETQLTSYFAGATGEDGPATELQSLKSQLVQLRAVYREAHPSVKAVKDQIAAIERELAPSKEMQSLQERLANAQREYRAAERDLAPEDPAIAEKRSAIVAIQEDLAARIQKETASGSGDFLSAQLQSRVAVAKSRLELMQEQRAKLDVQIRDLQDRIQRTPEVERGLQSLTRDYETLSADYRDILSKQQEAQLAENLESNQKSEKFTFLELPARPEKPSSPERGKLMALAFFVALGIGGAAAMAAEMMMATIRGKNHLAGLIEGHPIAIIPFIPSTGDKPRITLPKLPMFGRSTRRIPAAAE